MPVLFSLDQATRSYGSGDSLSVVLHPLLLQIPGGQRIAVVGHSGAGKTTLLNLLGALDSPSGGHIIFHPGAGDSPRNFSHWPPKQLDDLRKNFFGFVFQKANLLDHLSVVENVALVLNLLGIPARERKDKAQQVLEKLGLAKLCQRKPGDLSGGERQRVAVARALTHNPEVVFADEPTGNLDPGNAEKVFGLLSAWQQQGDDNHPRTLFLVTHNIHAACRHCDLLIVMRGGEVVACPGTGLLINTPAEIGGWFQQHVQEQRQPAIAALAVSSRASDLQDSEQGLLAMVQGVEPGIKSDIPLERWQLGRKPGVIRFFDLFWLAWNDLSRKQHWPASIANMALIFFAMLLGFAGCGFYGGEEKLRAQVEELGPRALTVDGLRVASLDSAKRAELREARFPDGRLLSDPQSRPFYYWNTAQLSFLLRYTPGDTQQETLSITGRSIAPEDPFLESRGWQFSTPNAREIMGSEEFLARLGWDGKPGSPVYIDTGKQPLALAVKEVFAPDVSLKANYILPDALYQAIRDGVYSTLDYPARYCDFSPIKVADLQGLNREKLVVDASAYGLRVEFDTGKVRLWVKDLVPLPAQEFQSIVADILKAAGWEGVGQLWPEEAPVPIEEKCQYGRATVYLEKMEDLEPAVRLVRKIGIEPVDPQKIGMVRLFIETVRPLSRGVSIFAVVVMLLVLLNLGVTMVDRVRQKKLEISIYRTCGMSGGRIIAVFFMEGLLLSIPAAFVAWLLLGSFLVWHASAKANSEAPVMPFELSGWATLVVLVLIALLSSVACGLAAYFAKVGKLASSLT